jgi:hypothetical protein
MKHDLRNFLDSIEKDQKREDCKALVKILEEESGYKATLHEKIVGFGIYHYKYDCRGA